MSAAVAVELGVLEKRAKCVELARQGKSYSVIAGEVGYASKASVAEQIAAWAAETKPSAEQTEELRKLQNDQIDALHAKLWPRLDSEDYLAVTDRLVKLMDRKARLMGLDLQQGISITLVTREALAGALWAADDVVDVEPTEIKAGGDA